MGIVLKNYENIVWQPFDERSNAKQNKKAVSAVKKSRRMTNSGRNK